MVKGKLTQIKLRSSIHRSNKYVIGSQLLIRKLKYNPETNVGSLHTFTFINLDMSDLQRLCVDRHKTEMSPHVTLGAPSFSYISFLIKFDRLVKIMLKETNSYEVHQIILSKNVTCNPLLSFNDNDMHCIIQGLLLLTPHVIFWNPFESV